MNTPTKLGAFAVVLVAAFAAAAGVGSAVGPLDRTSAEHDSSEHDSSQHDSPEHDSSQHDSVDGSQHDGRDSAALAEEIPAGLMVSQRGYTLALTDDELPAGDRTPVEFRVLGPDGRPVTSYDETHDRDLHCIAVRRDMAGFQHVHPELAADGTWSTRLALTPGEWRLFADFAAAADGEATTLGADLAVAGDYDPQPLPEPSRTAEVGDYTVALDGQLVAGEESVLVLTVRREDQPVTDLQPYLAASGHLVALRDGDLAYLHVHPAGEPGDGTTQPGPDITFYATAPSPGSYRLFLDFRHDGVVRTAEFTARTDGSGAAGSGADAESEADGDGHSH